MRAPDRSSPRVGWMLAWIGLFGLALAGWCGWVITAYGPFTPWVPVEARVTAARWEDRRPHADRPPPRRFRLRYVYEVDGRQFVGTRHSYRDVGQEVEKLDLRSGQRVRAWVDAERPERAVLRRGVGWVYKAGLALGVVICGYVVLMGVSLGGEASARTRATEGDAPPLSHRVSRILGPLIGGTIFFGGLAYALYAIVAVVRAG